MGTGRRRPAVLAAAAVLGAAVLVGGCSGEGGGSRSSQDAAAAPAVAQAPKADAGAAGKNAVPGSGAGAAPAQPSAVATADARLIAYTAQLTLVVEDVDKVAAQARDLAAGAGGYVGKETVNGSGGPGAGGEGRGMYGEIVLKVPSASYQQTLDRLAGLGKVASRNSQAEDLTQQSVDVASRLQSQQASVERVRALMAEARSLADVVSLESELSRRQADLDSLQRQLQQLSSRTSLSTITLDLKRESAPVVQAVEKKEGFWASVGSALGGGWHVLGAIVKGLLVALAAVSPFLLVLGPLGWMIWFVNRRGAARKASRPAPAEASDPWTTPQDGPDEQ
jgi:hypothetical protein